MVGRFSGSATGHLHKELQEEIFWEGGAEDLRYGNYLPPGVSFAPNNSLSELTRQPKSVVALDTC